MVVGHNGVGQVGVKDLLVGPDSVQGDGATRGQILNISLIAIFHRASIGFLLRGGPSSKVLPGHGEAIGRQGNRLVIGSRHAGGGAAGPVATAELDGVGVGRPLGVQGGAGGGSGGLICIRITTAVFGGVPPVKGVASLGEGVGGQRGGGIALRDLLGGHRAACGPVAIKGNTISPLGVVGIAFGSISNIISPVTTCSILGIPAGKDAALLGGGSQLAGFKGGSRCKGSAVGDCESRPAFRNIIGNRVLLFIAIQIDGVRICHACERPSIIRNCTADTRNVKRMDACAVDKRRRSNSRDRFSKMNGSKSKTTKCTFTNRYHAVWN